MGYASFSTGYKGIVRRRDYRVLVASELTPTTLVNGVPTSWTRTLVVGHVIEQVHEFVGLKYSDAMNTTSDITVTGGTIKLTATTTFTSGTTPLETYAREIERYKENPDSGLWNVRVTIRQTSYS